jgi:hypothetical protein
MRNISAEILEQLASGHVCPFLLASIQFESGTVYMWTGIGPLNWNGQTWQGLGQFAGVSEIRLTSEVTAESVTLSLSGIPPDMVEGALNEIRQGNIAQIFLGFASPETGAVISDPVPVAVGNTDVPTLTDGGDSCTIQITIETAMAGLQRSSNRRYTGDDQRQEYPDDHGFDAVPALQSWNGGSWGKK